jgi:hypothetical protein
MAQATRVHSTPRRTVSRRRPATQAERDAIAFKPISVKFERTSQQWEAAYTSARIAVIMLAKTQEELSESCDKLAKTGQAPTTLDNMIHAKLEFLELAKLIDIATSRCFLMLERLGYDPDNNPPPDNGEYETLEMREGGEYVQS